MPDINKRYVRIAPNGDETIAVIKTEDELKHHRDLAAKGFVYKEVIPNEGKGSVCVSCEG